MDGAEVKPLVLRAVQTAQVMAQALYDQFHKGAEKAKFSRRGRVSIPQVYMDAISGRFSNPEAWNKIGGSLAGGDGVSVNAQSGTWSWKNSAIFHSIARKDDVSYDRTGGMWSGLHVRNFGTAGAVIEFRGQSLGQTGLRKKARGRVREGVQRKESVSYKVPNRFKAWAVLESHRVLVVAPDRHVQQSLEDAVGAVANSWAQQAIGAVAAPGSSMSALAGEFVAAMRGGR